MPSARARPASAQSLPADAASVAEVHSAIECLGRLAALYQERREQLAASVSLTDQQWGVLEEIATEHFMPSLFARRRDSSPAAVSKILRQLVDKGLVVATIAKVDARQRHYALTAKAKRVMEQLRESREDAIREVWLGMDGNGMRAFTGFGTELIERLEQYASSAKKE
ncbi:MAG TPA: MarR family winged helix-turn-helix transcriptional regulator [Polyangiaceae bacterium]|jgi:DNA-binding MarR family transcriptional regulator|nr:MarR family winged helix-turn-helix transcriptional regulator [Polyangiaceae bacterium]